MPKRVVIKKADLPPLDLNSKAYLVRYRINSEDKNSQSYWSPIYAVPVDFTYSVLPVTINHNSGITTIAWSPVESLTQYDVWVSWTDGAEYSVTNKSLTSNVATITTSINHNFVTGQKVVVSGIDEVFNGTYTITSHTMNTISYARTYTNVSSTAVTPNGTASKYWSYYGRQTGTSVITQTEVGASKISVRVFRPSQTPANEVNTFLIYETLNANV